MTKPFDVGAADKAHVWHPYTQHAVVAPPRPIVRARGAYLYDDAGRPIFDGISSWWVTLHGHAQPEIADAIAAQARELEQVIFAGFTHEPAARLAEELVKRLPSKLERVFYSDDGSTAVEVAVKIALQLHQLRGRRGPATIVALANSYHGDTFGAMSVSARGLFTAPFADKLFDVIHLPDPATNDAADYLEQTIARLGERVAGAIVEPMLQGAGGMRMWPAASLTRMRELTSAHGIPLIADEVLTGFGRTGPDFACEHAGIAPDIICLSKGLTGGFVPMGVTATTNEIFDAFLSDDRSRTLFHGHSYTANPIACAAGIASLALLNDGCLAARRTIEASHRAAADRLRNHPLVRDARVLGTVFAFEIASNNSDGYLDPIGLRLGAFALERGVLLRPLGNTVYVLPPFCSTENDLSSVYTVIESFLETL